MTSPKHLRPDNLEALDIPVAQQGGRELHLEGARYGLPLSLSCAEIVVGGGPPQHTHPYIEVFVISEGRGRYTVNDYAFDAQAGDIVIVPEGAKHAFVNTGEDTLRHTVIHAAPVRAVTLVE